MRFFLDFLHQKVPKAGKEIPLYLKRALITSDVLLMVYFAICFFIFPLAAGQWQWVPVPFLALTGAALWSVRRGGVRINLAIYAVLCSAWVGWNIWYFGWSIGVQHFLTLLVVFIFFNVYEKPLIKILCLAGILAYRILLFEFAQRMTPVAPMSAQGNVAYQTVNTVSFFIMLAVICVIFSTSIQDTERQLRLKNQSLYKQAGTDPLTGLPNRRMMIETIERFRRENGDQPFSIAIADIDFFKKINDTHGHNCGDYALVKLTELFVTHAEGRYSACRWGGEEFCLFMPGMNLDEASVIMNDLCITVEKMKISYEEQDLSLTITIGVEENDFSSPLDDLLNKADEKLYMGKNAGRNRVVA